MKVSIVTLAFRQERFVREAIESVLSQDHDDLEYIVVDPGSSDGTRAIVDEYADRIAARVYEPDEGPSDGLNRGFARATGDVYGFINGDDALLPGALRCVVGFLRQRPDCDLVMGGGRVVDARGSPMRRYKASSFTISGQLYGGASWLQQSTFITRRAFERVGGFNAANKTCWDAELFLKAVAAGAKVGYVSQELGLFRIHPTSITGSGSVAEQYRQDCARLFRQLRGRDWTTLDDILSVAYRANKFLTDPAQIVDSVRYRLRQRAS